MSKHYKIPSWSPSKKWHYTFFKTKEEFREFVKSLFKEPGKYKFDEISIEFNKSARKFNKDKIYCEAPEGSHDYIEYWDSEKEKCRKGVIYFGDNGGTWYLPRFYYHWINFLQIYNKSVEDFTFPEVRDVQYHMALYEELSHLFGKNAATLKARQKASSYFHLCKLYNKYLFENGFVGKIGASNKAYMIEPNGSWKFLDHYHNFTNTNTAWACSNNPNQPLAWQQKIVTRTADGRDVKIGTMASITGITFEKDPTAGVGGPCHRKDTKILMASGEYKEVQNIKKGEYTLGVDNLPKKVIQLFNGVSDIYKVEQTRGNDYYTTGDHLLYLISRDTKVATQNKTRLIKTKNWNNLTDYQKSFYVGIKNKKQLKFYNNYKEPTLDPYFVGLWIGDGYRDKAGIIVNKTADIEILEYLQHLSIITDTALTINRKEENRYNPEMYTTYFPISINGIDTHFTEQFIKYNLYYNKHIPDDYLYGSIETRLQVLAGIIDTDGYYDAKDGNFQVCCKSTKLAKQYVFLCRSLGAYVKENIQSSTEHEVAGKVIKFTETNRLSIYFQDTSIIPTRISRKQGSNIRIRNIHTSPIKKITNNGIEDYYGIQVEDSVYYLEDLTITHNCTEFFYEEGGIAPTADQTYIYMKSALKEGSIVSGLFTIAGSVGKLEQANPLRNFVTDPVGNDFYAVYSNLLDEHGTEGYSALFIPEHWGMPPFIDKYGNSMINDALEHLALEDKQWREGYIDENGQKVPPKTPELYQLERSQHPRNIREAFAIRTRSVFPVKHTTNQIRKIEDGDIYLKNIDLERGDNGKIVYKKSEREPIPYNSSPSAIMRMEDKRGCVVIHQHPGDNPEWGTYFWSADPVETGDTKTSDSLAAIYIYMNHIEVTRIDAEGNSTICIEGDKLVAEWVGRYDDVNETNEQMSLLIEYYNSWGISEKNKPSLNTHMILKKRTRHLADSKEMLFDAELGMTDSIAIRYGWSNSVGTWKKILQYGVDSLSEELSEETDEDGKITKIRYGVERIPFINLLKEMQEYTPGKNFDRVIAYCALIAFVKLQQAKTGIKQKTERAEASKTNARPITIQTFRSIGQTLFGKNQMKQSAFRSVGRKM